MAEQRWGGSERDVEADTTVDSVADGGRGLAVSAEQPGRSPEGVGNDIAGPEGGQQVVD